MKTRRHLERAEWIFLKDGACLPEEHQACYEYEMAREAVHAGHAKSQRNPDWTWRDSVRLLRYFPEWPKTPWLALKPELRQKRLAKYQKDVATEDAEWRQRRGWNAVEGDVERLRDDQGHYHKHATFFREELDFRYGDEGRVTTYFVHRVNWEVTNKELLARFENWLKAGRKWIARQKTTARVRSSWKQTTPFERLKRLAVRRLLDAYGFHEATTLVELEKCQPYPGGQVVWNHAAKKSKDEDLFGFCLATPLAEDCHLTNT
jgi:hypothetical protein